MAEFRNIIAKLFVEHHHHYHHQHLLNNLLINKPLQPDGLGVELTAVQRLNHNLT